jgi:hypothetical protein
MILGPHSENVSRNLLKQVKINLPLLDAIKQVPAYAKNKDPHSKEGISHWASQFYPSAYSPSEVQRP